MKSMRALLLAAVYLLAAQLVASEAAEIRTDDLPCYRLPVNVEPTKYEIHLNFSSLDSNDYEGSVDISLKVPNYTTEELAGWGLEDVPCAKQHDPNTIVLHADKSLEIQNISVTSGSHLAQSPLGKPDQINELVRDEAKQMIAIKLDRGIDATPEKISIIFKGRMRQDKRGVYLSTHNDGERVFKHIVSQFQPTDARTVFPCFDEPRFRVPFSVRVSHPRDLTAYGNTEVAEVLFEDGLKTTQFATTPSMPVHMVAFAIGEFDEPVEVISTLDRYRGKRKERKIRVITAPGKRETGEYASRIALSSLQWFEKYIEYDFPLEKLDIIAIADHDKDNTESWGLTFVRDTLLWADDETKPYTKLTTTVNIAHVVVHQWFANLISAGWWSDLWITESVAAQFSLMFAETHGAYTGSEFLVRVGLMSGVLDADQAGDLHPLSPAEENLQTSDQIYGIFDNLEFMKSASLGQMVQETVGFLDYQLLLRSLIREHAYKTVNFQDYKHTILTIVGDLSGRKLEDLPDLLETFPKYNGVPLVECSSTSDKSPKFEMGLMSVAEARQDVDEPRQEVAIKVSAGPVKNKYSVRLISANNDNWTQYNFTKLDIGPTMATYYRTRYSDELYDRLQTAIENRRMNPMDRVQILDDANSLVKSGLIGQERFRSLLDSYANEDDFAVVLAILAASRTYRSLFPQDATPLKSDAAISYVFRGFKFSAAWLETLPMQRARELVLTTMVEEDREGVRAAALDAFEKANGTVALFLREPIYKAVVLSGSEHVNQLLNHLSETESYEEQVRLVSALALSKDTGVLERVKVWLESSGLKEETKTPLLNTISAALPQ